MGRLLDAVRSGDKRVMLEALRDDVAETIEDTKSGRDMAALSKRLMEICEAIDALPSPQSTNPVDEMAALISEYDDYEDPRDGDA